VFIIVLFVDSETHVFCVGPPFNLVQQSFNHISKSSLVKHGSRLPGGSTAHVNGSGGDDDASPNGNSADGSSNEGSSDSNES
jgi:hypothetical protein